MSQFDSSRHRRFERVAERVLPRPLFDWLRGLAEEPGISAQFRGRHIGDWWVNSVYDFPLADKDTPWAYDTQDDNAILSDLLRKFTTLDPEVWDTEWECRKPVT